MTKNVIEEHGYSVEQSISGKWRLIEVVVVIYDDSACEELNGDREAAEDFFCEYLKEYMKAYEQQYDGYNVSIIEDSEYYHINFNTGLGEAHYPKMVWSLEDALEDQSKI